MSKIAHEKTKQLLGLSSQGLLGPYFVHSQDDRIIVVKGKLGKALEYLDLAFKALEMKFYMLAQAHFFKAYEQIGAYYLFLYNRNEEKKGFHRKKLIAAYAGVAIESCIMGLLTRTVVLEYFSSVLGFMKACRLSHNDDFLEKEILDLTSSFKKFDELENSQLSIQKLAFTMMHIHSFLAQIYEKNIVESQYSDHDAKSVERMLSSLSSNSPEKDALYAKDLVFLPIAHCIKNNSALLSILRNQGFITLYDNILKSGLSKSAWEELLKRN